MSAFAMRPPVHLRDGHSVASFSEAAAIVRGYALAHPGAPFFSELCLRVPGGSAARVVEGALQKDVVPGVDLGRFGEPDLLLVSVNELHAKADLDRLVAVLEEVA